MRHEVYVVFMPCPTYLFCFIVSLLGCRYLTCSKFISSFLLVFFYILGGGGAQLSGTCLLSSHSVCSVQFLLLPQILPETEHELMSFVFVWYLIMLSSSRFILGGISFCSLCVSFSLVINSLFFSFMLTLFQKDYLKCLLYRFKEIIGGNRVQWICKLDHEAKFPPISKWNAFISWSLLT